MQEREPTVRERSRSRTERNPGLSPFPWRESTVERGRERSRSRTERNPRLSPFLWRESTVARGRGRGAGLELKEFLVFPRSCGEDLGNGSNDRSDISPLLTLASLELLYECDRVKI